MKKSRILLLCVFIAFVVFILSGLDNKLQTTYYTIEDNRLPQAFDGYTIVQLSDFHNIYFGNEQKDLLDMVENENPDMIVLTGDIIDRKNKDYESVSVLVNGLVKIAPVFAVFGNHEEYTADITEKMTALYRKYGVELLDNNGLSILEGIDSIYLFGLTDCGERKNEEVTAYFDHNMPQMSSDTYGILLYHRSNQFDYLTQYGFRLVLSGHLHGGVIRIPYIGGLLSPEGILHLFPKYAGGEFSRDGTTLISSRGLAGSHAITRLYNRPELVVITLTR